MAETRRLPPSLWSFSVRHRAFVFVVCSRRQYCRENAAYLVKNQLKKVSLKDIAVEFLIEAWSMGHDAAEISVTMKSCLDDLSPS